MPKPNEKKKQWNDQWWSEVVHKKKTALAPILNVRKKKSSQQKPAK